MTSLNARVRRLTSADETQWESTLAGHMLMLIMDSQRRNTLFRSPLPPNAQHVIDVGTGAGDWALDVADAYPNRRYFQTSDSQQMLTRFSHCPWR